MIRSVFVLFKIYFAQESKIVLSEESDVEITEDFGDDDVQSKFSSTFGKVLCMLCD